MLPLNLKTPLSEQDLHFYPITRSPEENQERYVDSIAVKKSPLTVLQSFYRCFTAKRPELGCSGEVSQSLRRCTNVALARRFTSLKRLLRGRACTRKSTSVIKQRGSSCCKTEPCESKSNSTATCWLLFQAVPNFTRKDQISLERTLHLKSARKQLGVPPIDERQPAEVEFRFVKHRLILLAWCGCVGKYDGKC